jgi:hypothetical protein
VVVALEHYLAKVVDVWEQFSAHDDISSWQVESLHEVTRLKASQPTIRREVKAE